MRYGFNLYECLLVCTVTRKCNYNIFVESILYILCESDIFLKYLTKLIMIIIMSQFLMRKIKNPQMRRLA